MLSMMCIACSRYEKESPHAVGAFSFSAVSGQNQVSLLIPSRRRRDGRNPAVGGTCPACSWSGALDLRSFDSRNCGGIGSDAFQVAEKFEVHVCITSGTAACEESESEPP
jgi:hypothetical protein